MYYSVPLDIEQSYLHISQKAAAYVPSVLFLVVSGVLLILLCGLKVCSKFRGCASHPRLADLLIFIEATVLGQELLAYGCEMFRVGQCSFCRRVMSKN